MNGLTDLMASSIRPLRRRRRTAQRGKPMTQSQRWGKVVTIMPIPGGEISTSDIWKSESKVEEALDEAIRAADAEPATGEYIFDEEVDASNQQILTDAVEVVPKPAPRKRAKKI